MIWPFKFTFPRISNARVVDANSRCPACGHTGCKLTWIPPQATGQDQKGRTGIKLETGMVERECRTCHAKCYEKPVVPAEKWIAK